MRVRAEEGNAVVSYEGDKKIITIPTTGSIPVILFMCFWLCGWVFGMFMGIGMLFNGGPAPFMIIWLTGWTIGGGHAIFTVLWLIAGKEIIEIDRSQIAIRKEVLFLKFSKEYDVKSIKNIRVVDVVDSGYRRRQTPRKQRFKNGGLIHFDYGMKTINFGTNIESAEATHLLENHFNWINNNQVI